MIRGTEGNTDQEKTMINNKVENMLDTRYHQIYIKKYSLGMNVVENVAFTCLKHMGIKIKDNG